MADQMTTGQAEAFAWFMRVYHDATPADVEPASVPGYWRYLHPCRGCVHPLDGPFPDGCGITHTVYYRDRDQRDTNGRWLSPYRTWKAARRSPDRRKQES